MYKKLASAVLAFTALSSAHISAYAETIEDGRVWLNVNMIGHLPAENWGWYAGCSHAFVMKAKPSTKC